VNLQRAWLIHKPQQLHTCKYWKCGSASDYHRCSLRPLVPACGRWLVH